MQIKTVLKYQYPTSIPGSMLKYTPRNFISKYLPNKLTWYFSCIYFISMIIADYIAFDIYRYRQLFVKPTLQGGL